MKKHLAKPVGLAKLVSVMKTKIIIRQVTEALSEFLTGKEIFQDAYLSALGNMLRKNPHFRIELYAMTQKAKSQGENLERLAFSSPVTALGKALNEACHRMSKQVSVQATESALEDIIPAKGPVVRTVKDFKNKAIPVHQRDLRTDVDLDKVDPNVLEAKQELSRLFAFKTEVYGLSKLEQNDSPYVSSTETLLPEWLQQRLEESGIGFNPYEYASLHEVAETLQIQGMLDSRSNVLLELLTEEITEVKDGARVKAIALHDSVTGYEVCRIPTYMV